MTTMERMRAILDSVAWLYQTHTWRGQVVKEGVRGTERRYLLRLDDIEGKAVLDLGCSTGAESLWAMEKGASLVCGVDRDSESLRVLGELAAFVGYSARVRHSIQDLNRPIPEFLKQQWETVFCFSLVHHLGYRRVWNEVESAKVVYVEMPAEARCSDEWFEEGGWMVERLGDVPSNREDQTSRRPLWRLSR